MRATALSQPLISKLTLRPLASMVTPVRPSISVEIISDTVCPWCYVGKRRLEKAIEQFKGRLDVQVHWLPFQLNPTAPKEGQNKLQMYRDKFGAARVELMIPQMAQTFKELGLDYSIGGETGNTMDSHRLLWWAYKTGGAQAQNQVAEGCFDAYMCKEKYIGSQDVLLEVAGKAGLDVEAAKAFLSDLNAGRAEVEAELLRGHSLGVSGVPFFIVDGKFKVSGAQPTKVFAEAFEQLAKDKGVPADVQGAVCLPGGEC